MNICVRADAKVPENRDKIIGITAASVEYYNSAFE